MLTLLILTRQIRKIDHEERVKRFSSVALWKADAPIITEPSGLLGVTGSHLPQFTDEETKAGEVQGLRDRTMRSARGGFRPRLLVSKNHTLSMHCPWMPPGPTHFLSFFFFVVFCHFLL